MSHESLLKFSKNIYSQNGDDGIIERIFTNVQTKNKTCCEFGAWDGIHLSNCRKLILEGWQAVMIEADQEKYKKLTKTYAENPDVLCVNTFVDTANNSVAAICTQSGMPYLDFLSIDIDGLDYQIFEQLTIQPTVVCVEVNAGHLPEDTEFVPVDIAMHNVGQPLGLFVYAADKQGYGLVAYNGNAYFVRRDALCADLDEISPSAAYEEYVAHLDRKARLWMSLVNRGMVPPYYHYNNRYLGIRSLKLNVFLFAYELLRCSRKIGFLSSARRFVQGATASIKREKVYLA